jgi:transcriptional regulator with XRE-family HTH domain
MAKQNQLTAVPPFAVEQSIKTLGLNLRTARLRRHLTIHDLSQKLGVGYRAIADAEKGKPTTSMVVYVALLWALGLLDQLNDVADPAKDKEGLILALSREPLRSSHRTDIDNDF